MTGQSTISLKSRPNWSIRAVTKVKYHQLTRWSTEDDYHTGCRNVSQCQQQSYSGLRSAGRSYSAYLWKDSKARIRWWLKITTGHLPHYNSSWNILYLNRSRTKPGCRDHWLTCLFQKASFESKVSVINTTDCEFLTVSKHFKTLEEFPYLYFKLWSNLVATPTKPRRLNTT